MEVLVETLHPDLRGAAYGPGWSMRDLLAQDGIGGKPNGMEGAHIFEPFVYPGNCKGGGGAEKPHEICTWHTGRSPGPEHPAGHRRCGRCRCAGRSVPTCRTGKAGGSRCSRNGRSRQQTGVCRVSDCLGPGQALGKRMNDRRSLIRNSAGAAMNLDAGVVDEQPVRRIRSAEDTFPYTARGPGTRRSSTCFLPCISVGRSGAIRAR